MRDRIQFTAVALEGDPTNCLAEPIRMKLFFESDSPEACAEVYTNIDIYNERAAIAEKDVGYRRPLLAAIAATVG